jgi:hypothetical protein
MIHRYIHAHTTYRGIFKYSVGCTIRYCISMLLSAGTLLNTQYSINTTDDGTARHGGTKRLDGAVQARTGRSVTNRRYRRRPLYVRDDLTCDNR